MADVGFLGVETYTLPQHITLERAVRGLKDVGLRVMGMHAPLPVGENREVVLRLAEEYHCDRVIFPGGGEVEKYKTAAGIQVMVDAYNETGRYLAARGLHFIQYPGEKAAPSMNGAKNVDGRLVLPLALKRGCALVKIGRTM